MLKKLLFSLALLAGFAQNSISQTQTARMLSGVNSQTGTTYTFVCSDATKLVAFNNASGVAANLFAATDPCSGPGIMFSAVNNGAGSVTITPASGTITVNGVVQGNIVLTKGQGVDLWNDGTNYFAEGTVSSGPPPAGFPRLDQVTDQNTNRLFNQGGSIIGFTNGPGLDLSGETSPARVPNIAGSTTSLNGQISFDTTGANFHGYNGADGTIALFSQSGINDGDLAGFSIVGGKYTLKSLGPPSTTSGTIVTANITNVNEGDTICWDSTATPPTFINCSTGVPINLLTADYTVNAINDRGTALIANSASPHTHTLCTPGNSGDCDANWFIFDINKNFGPVTVNTTAPAIFDSTGTQSEVLLEGEGCSYLTDPNSQIVYPKCHSPRILAGNGISLSRSPYFLTVSATPASATSNGLISGGGVTWTSGLTFEVGAATYSIAGSMFSSAEGAITLNAADPSNPRIDIIGVDSTGTVIKITGTPAANPAAPSVDPTAQLALTFVTIPAGSTTPVLSQLVIYQNNVGAPTEWNCTNTSNINCNSTNNPFGSFTHSIEATTAANTNAATLTVGSGTVNLANYQTFSFFIRNKATWPNAKSIQIFFRNGSAAVGTAITFKNGVYGFNQTNTTTYQQIAIPVTAFQTGVAPITNVVFQVTGSGGTIGYYLGNIQLQGGFVGGGGSGGGNSLNLQVDGVNCVSPCNFQDNGSVTFSQSVSGGVTNITATAISGGVTSLTGDGTLFNNNASTGAVILSPVSVSPNQVFAGPSSNGTSNLVQSASAQSNGATSLVKAYPNSVGGGHLLIAVAGCFNTFCDSASPTSVTSSNNTWTRGAFINHGLETTLFYACNANAGADTVTLTSSGSSFEMHLQIFEFSGNATVSCLDQTGTNGVINSTNIYTATTSGGVSQSTELIFAAFSGNNTPTPGAISGVAPYTTLLNTISTQYAMGTAISTQTTGLSGTQTATGASTASVTLGTGLIATFKLNSSGSASGAFRAIALADLPLHTPSICSSCAPTAVGQTAAITDTFMDISTTAQLYRFSASINCTTTSASATATVNLKFTDTSNTAQTVSATATCTSLGASSIAAIDRPFRVKANTSITYGVTIANTPTYDVDVRLEKMN